LQAQKLINNDEEDISAVEAQEKQQARIPGQNGHPQRPEGFGSPQVKGTEETHRFGRARRQALSVS
jgi:hypothetical protein